MLAWVDLSREHLVFVVISSHFVTVVFFGYIPYAFTFLFASFIYQNGKYRSSSLKFRGEKSLAIVVNYFNLRLTLLET